MKVRIVLLSVLVLLVLTIQVSASFWRPASTAPREDGNLYPPSSHGHHRRDDRTITASHESLPMAKRLAVDTSLAATLLLPRAGYDGSSSSGSSPDFFGTAWPKSPRPPPRTPRAESGTSLSESSSHSLSSSPGLKLVRHRPVKGGLPPSQYYSPDLKPTKNVPPAHRKQQARLKAQQQSVGSKGWRDQRPASLKVPAKDIPPLKHPREYLKGKQPTAPTTSGIKGHRPAPLKIPGKAEPERKTLGELMKWGQPKAASPKPSTSQARPTAPAKPSSKAKPPKPPKPFSKLNLQGVPGSPPPPVRTKGVAHRAASKVASGAKQVTKGVVKGVSHGFTKGFKKLFTRDSLDPNSEEGSSSLSRREDTGVVKKPAPGGGYYLRHTRAAEKPLFPEGPRFFKDRPSSPEAAKDRPRSEPTTLSRPPRPKLWEYLQQPNPANSPPRQKAAAVSPHPSPSKGPKKKGVMTKAKHGLKRLGKKTFF